MNILEFLLSQFADLAPVYKSNPGYVPAYEPQHTVTTMEGAQIALNIYYFATLETANWFAGKFSADHVASVPYLGSGGPFSSSARELWLVWRDGTAINAGQLAKYYTLNPNATPQTAENAVWSEIAKARAGGATLPQKASA